MSSVTSYRINEAFGEIDNVVEILKEEIAELEERGEEWSHLEAEGWCHGTDVVDHLNELSEVSSLMMDRSLSADDITQMVDENETYEPIIQAFSEVSGVSVIDASSAERAIEALRESGKDGSSSEVLAAIRLLIDSLRGAGVLNGTVPVPTEVDNGTPPVSATTDTGLSAND